MNCLTVGLIVAFNVFVLIRCAVVVTECDYKRFADGCEDTYGSVCNRTANECQCKPGFTVHIENFCLPPKNFSDPCFVSDQCESSDISNIGCYVDDKELDVRAFKLWQQTDNLFKIIGVCVCPPTHYLNGSQECISKKQVNDDCSSSQQCIQLNSYCDQSSKSCKCKPTYRYSIRKRRCVSQLIGETCADNDHCIVHDPNAECRIGSCQCRPGYMLSQSGRCVMVRVRGTSNHLLMMLVVVATALVFALLSTAHRKWASSDDLFGGGTRSRNQLPLNNNWVTRRTFPTPHSMVFPNSNISPNQTYPVSLTVPSLALIWPLRQQNEANMYVEDGPPSYDEAVNQSLRLSDINNSLTVVTNSIDNNCILNGNSVGEDNTVVANDANNDSNSANTANRAERSPCNSSSNMDTNCQNAGNS